MPNTSPHRRAPPPPRLPLVRPDAPEHPTAHSPQQRWQRIGLGVRLACNPHKPEVLQVWLALGAQLSALGVTDKTDILQRSIRPLLQVAHDQALPAFWSRVCLEATTRPLARLTTLLLCASAEAQSAQGAPTAQAAQQTRAQTLAAVLQARALLAAERRRLLQQALRRAHGRPCEVRGSDADVRQRARPAAAQRCFRSPAKRAAASAHQLRGAAGGSARARSAAGPLARSAAQRQPSGRHPVGRTHPPLGPDRARQRPLRRPRLGGGTSPPGQRLPARTADGRMAGPAITTLAAATAAACDARQIRTGRAGAGAAPPAIFGRRVLCVGGMRGAQARYKRLLEGAGGSFAFHDGGVEDSVHRLAPQLQAADLVVRQAGCLNHGSYHRVKALCRRLGKPCVFLERASLSGFARGLGLGSQAAAAATAAAAAVSAGILPGPATDLVTTPQAPADASIHHPTWTAFGAPPCTPSASSPR